MCVADDGVERSVCVCVCDHSGKGVAVLWPLAAS